MLAKHVLYQLSYAPVSRLPGARGLLRHYESFQMESEAESSTSNMTFADILSRRDAADLAMRWSRPRAAVGGAFTWPIPRGLAAP